MSHLEYYLLQIQYEFVHKALVEALTTKEMEISAADFCRYYWSLLEDRSEYSNQTKLEEQYEVGLYQFFLTVF